MSYWVRLNDPETGKVLEMDEVREDGGTYVLGGTRDCELNVTYNYSPHFSVREKIKDRVAADALPALVDAVKHLGTRRDPDYWKCTPGNVGYMCSILVTWALKHPTGVFEVN